MLLLLGKSNNKSNNMLLLLGTKSNNMLLLLDKSSQGTKSTIWGSQGDRMSLKWLQLTVLIME